jgi:hypothetical protein
VNEKKREKEIERNAVKYASTRRLKAIVDAY